MNRPGTIVNRHWGNLTGVLARWILGGSYVYMGAMKALHPVEFLKLVRQRSLKFENREHFFHVAATLMRRILVDHARSERRVKRDGGDKVPLEHHMPIVSGLPSADMLDIDRALQDLQKIDPVKSRMIELRFFLGSTSAETAELLNMSKATVDREVRFARGWLYQRLQGSGEIPAGPP